ncbi:MAG: SAM-dependent methyltransferase [Alkalilacustris sp.]
MNAPMRGPSSPQVPPVPPAPPQAGPSATALRRYYDVSTARFLAVGGSGRSLAIHRGLWDVGVTDAETAADRVNARIVRRMMGLGRPAPGLLRDLGCGVGGSLLHFARAWPAARLEGITLSPRQAQMARSHVARARLDDRITVRCGDFLAAAMDADSPPAPADLAVAIESHVHAPSAAAFLRAARAGLAPGGVLVVVDDMLATAPDRLSPREAALVATFRRGWHLGHVPHPEGLRAAAAEFGFDCVADEDLTPHLRLDRRRDRLLHLVAPSVDALGLGRWPLFSNMIGGNALTLAYLRGVMRYRMMVFAT